MPRRQAEVNIFKVLRLRSILGASTQNRRNRAWLCWPARGGRFRPCKSSPTSTARWSRPVFTARPRSRSFERLGIDTGDVLAAAATKWNFQKFHPGLVGAHCIGVDPYYLTCRAEKAGYDPQGDFGQPTHQRRSRAACRARCVRRLLQRRRDTRVVRLSLITQLLGKKRRYPPRCEVTARPPATARTHRSLAALKLGSFGRQHEPSG